MPFIPTNPWSWFVFGVILMVAELIVPGFVIIFFGGGAVVVSGLLLCVNMAPWLQAILFLVFSVLFLLVFRRYLPKTFSGSETQETLKEGAEEYSGELCEVTEAIDPLRPGKVSFHGTSWQARAEEPMAVGTMARIIKRENIVLFIKKQE